MATFRGRVIHLADGSPVNGADVWLVSADRHESTDSSGRFQFADVPAGVQLVEVRHLGLSAQRDTISLSSAHENVRTYALSEQSATLDTVRTFAGTQKYLSPMLRGFEDRRLSHQGGHFVSDSVFRRNENSSVAGIIESRVPGLTAVGGKTLVSTRKACMGFAMAHPANCQGGAGCYVTIYLDGALYYTPPPADTARPQALMGSGAPDMTRAFQASELAGAEYYADGASAPAGMHSNDQGCGTLWLWTRER